MTKQKMIKTIQQREAELWLKMQEYKLNEAPLHGGYEEFRRWEDEDNYMRCLRFEWCGVCELMETIGVSQAWELPEHGRASEILSFIWKQTHSIED